MANWRYHTVEVGADRSNGFRGTDVVVRTDGKAYQKREQVRMDTSVSLKGLMDQLKPLFEQHPDADVKQEHEQYTEHDYYTVIEWWTPLSEEDPLMNTIVAFVEKAEAFDRECAKQQLDRIRKEHPDLL